MKATNVKRRMRLMVPCGLSLLCVLLQTACRDQFESTYPSLADAKQAGAVDRGWSPDFLPEGSSNIHEAHNIDTNQTWCAFDFPPNEADTLRRNLAIVPPAEASGIEVRDPGVTWWPDVLQGRLDPNAISQSGFEMYKSGSMVFAIDWTNGRAFFHRQRA